MLSSRFLPKQQSIGGQSIDQTSNEKPIRAITHRLKQSRQKKIPYYMLPNSCVNFTSLQQESMTERENESLQKRMMPMGATLNVRRLSPNVTTAES